MLNQVLGFLSPEGSSTAKQMDGFKESGLTGAVIAVKGIEPGRQINGYGAQVAETRDFEPIEAHGSSWRDQPATGLQPHRHDDVNRIVLAHAFYERAAVRV